MSCVYPVVILSAVFCTVISLFFVVFDILGDQLALPCFSMDHVMVLFVLTSVSLLLPQWMSVSAFIIFSVFLAFNYVSFMYCE